MAEVREGQLYLFGKYHQKLPRLSRVVVSADGHHVAVNGKTYAELEEITQVTEIQDPITHLTILGNEPPEGLFLKGYDGDRVVITAETEWFKMSKGQATNVRMSSIVDVERVSPGLLQIEYKASDLRNDRIVVLVPNGKISMVDVHMKRTDIVIEGLTVSSLFVTGSRGLIRIKDSVVSSRLELSGLRARFELKGNRFGDWVSINAKHSSIEESETSPSNKTRFTIDCWFCLTRFTSPGLKGKLTQRGGTVTVKGGLVLDLVGKGHARGAQLIG